MNVNDPVLIPHPRDARFDGGHAATTTAVVEGRDSSLPAQGYRLRIGATGIELDAADDAGAFYGQATLDQLRRVGGDAGIPTGVIADWPDIATRGVMLDISRDKVPTLKTVLDLVDRLAALKLNHIQLYTEHTFAYAGHDEVWADASPFTAEEIAQLQAFCATRFVELAANQNCLGHMERWLRHDRYRPLAIRPDGWEDARGRHRAPTTVDPSKPGSLELVRDLLGQLVPNFASDVVNVGLDEPWELPDERFSDYLAHVAKVRGLPELDGKEMLMWGDIVAHHPERAEELPDGVTIAEWGYEADHPFRSRAEVLAKADRPFWLCPGTSSWNTILGRTTNATTGCWSAALVGRDVGATGFLITDWGDNGHLQYLPVSEPAIAFGAAVSWCEAANNDIDLAAALDAHVFRDEANELGAALVALGDAHTGVGPQVPNNSTLVLHLLYPGLRFNEGIVDGLTVSDLEGVRAVLATEGDAVNRSRSGRSDAALVVDELRASVALVDLLCRDAQSRIAGDGTLGSVRQPTRDAFARELDEHIARHQELWLARNRPGGLPDSTRRLESLRDAYRA